MVCLGLSPIRACLLRAVSNLTYTGLSAMACLGLLGLLRSVVFA